MSDAAFPFAERPVLITGVPRSGTSLVAGVVACCGAWVGDTVPGGRSNPTGYFENRVLRESFVKRMLRELGVDPLGVDPLPTLDRVQAVEGLQRRVLDEIERQGYTGGVPWAYKGAKLTLLWPAWRAAFPEARWVLVRRDPEGIVHSCRNTHFMARHSDDPAFWHSFVDEYQRRLDGLRDSGAWYREVWPDRAVRGDRRPLVELIGDLGLTWEPETVDRMIEPRYWHSPRSPDG